MKVIAKKNLIFLSITVLLLMTACSRQEPAPGEAFQPPIEGIQWGMMPEEVAEILALPEECIQNNNGQTAVLLCESMDIFGQSADVEMTFDLQYQIGLLNMRVCYTDLPEGSLVETLDGMYGDFTAVDSEGVPSRWESEKIEELSERVQERFQYMWVDCLPENEEQGGFSKEAIWSSRKSQPLVTVTLGNDVLNYYGGNMAAYLIYDDDTAYERLQASRKGN